MPGIKTVFGSGGVNKGRAFGEPGALKDVFQVMRENGCTTIDTAALYGDSEKLLGEAKAPSQFIIDTKTKGGFGGKGYATKEKVIEEGNHSKEMLGSTVDIYYLHAQDDGTPIEDTFAGFNELYTSGFFKRLGLSNVKPADVQKIYDLCKEKGWPLPSVYQGNYSAVARKQEDELFPLLRKLGISFYAYSPIAGGFLTKSKKDIEEGKGRFDQNTPLGQMYGGMYAKPTLLDALAEWEDIAQEEGIPKAELAYRWVTYNSPLKPEHGDGIIVGASSLDQLKQTLKSCNSGPLSEKACKRIDEIWKKIEHEAPLDNYHSHAAKV